MRGAVLILNNINSSKCETATFEEKKGIGIIVLLLLLASGLFAQSGTDDVVYLNNGTFLRGKIIELIPGKTLSITLTGKDTLVVMMEDVKLISKENTPQVTVISDQNEIKEHNYTLLAELNFGLGLLEGLDRYLDSPQAQYSVMLSVFNGFKLSPIILLGLGIGLDVWNSRIFLPFYLDFRANFLRKDNTPFIYINTGYSLGWKSGSSGMDMGGAIAGIGIGAKFRVSPKNLMSVSLGYRFQQTRQYDVYYGVTSKSTLDAHLMNLKIGLAF